MSRQNIYLLRSQLVKSYNDEKRRETLLSDLIDILDEQEDRIRYLEEEINHLKDDIIHLEDP